jgi:hypothetical protein
VPWLRPGLANFNPQGLIVRTRPTVALVYAYIEKHKGRLFYCFCLKIGDLYFPDILCSVEPNLLCLLNCIIETIQMTAACGPWAVICPAVAYTVASLSLRKFGFESGAWSCKISGKQSVTETGFSSSNCWFSCQGCSTSAPH